MTAELAVVPAPPQSHEDPTGGRLVAWAAGLSAAHQIGTALCATAFVPQHFRGKPEEAAAAILYGDEIGLTPTQALQNLYVISGKPALYARTMVALVLAAGHEVWTVSKSDQEVVVAGRRRGTAHTIQESWTRGRAAKAGYTNNKKYDTDPQAMLYARAAADVCRQVAPDALAGLAYSVEEIELEGSEPTTTTKRAPRNMTAQRAPLPPEPPAELPVTTAEQVEPESGDGITQAQLRKIGALMRERDLTDRDEVLAYVSGVVGRDVTSRNDLTKSEAHRLIEDLEAVPTVDEATGEIQDDEPLWPEATKPGGRS